MKFLITTGVLALTLSGMLLAQTTNPALHPKTPAGSGGSAAKASRPQTPAKLTERQKFVSDVVNSAVALPQPDQQDRLRILFAATNVISPIDSKRATSYAKEGIRIETELVSSGQKPAVSMLASGHIDCAAAQTFVETIPPAAVLDAEQSLLGAITMCGSKVNQPAERKVDAGLQQGTLAARAILALMEAEGMKSGWSQTMFPKMFSSLPANAIVYYNDAPNFAAMFVRAAPEMDQDAVKTAGQKFLVWLSKLPEGPERQIAVNMTTDTLGKILGKDAYDELLRSDVLVQQIAVTAGQSAVIQPPDDGTVSILRALDNHNDRTEELQQMQPVRRAKEAAASGFASGTQGDRKQADHYFDIAFSSLEEVWSSRSEANSRAPAVVQEVSEAAAQVDAIAALQRAQRLMDPAAQAISMLAVARVVVGQQ